jgi:beta-lactamase class A
VIELLKPHIDFFPGEVRLYARNLKSGADVGLGQDDPVRTASTIKLPIMAAVFNEVTQGRAKWDERLRLRESDKVSGSGVLHEFSDGVELPLRDVVHLMIVVSDNTATNLVIDRITADVVNAFMDTLGLPRTRSMRKVRGDGTQLKDPSGWSKAGLLEENKRFGLGSTTSREMVALLEKLHRGEVVSPEASRLMLAILGRQQFKDAIGRYLGPYRVMSKSGSLDALRSDVGLVITPRGPIAMALTVDGMPWVDYSEENPGLALLGRLAAIIADNLV